MTDLTLTGDKASVLIVIGISLTTSVLGKLWIFYALYNKAKGDIWEKVCKCCKCTVGPNP